MDTKDMATIQRSHNPDIQKCPLQIFIHLPHHGQVRSAHERFHHTPVTGVIYGGRVHPLWVNWEDKTSRCRV